MPVWLKQENWESVESDGLWFSKTTMIVRGWKKRSKSLNEPPVGRKDWSIVNNGIQKISTIFSSISNFCKEKYDVLKNWLFEEEEFETLIIDEKVSLRSSRNKSMPNEEKEEYVWR